MTVEVGKSFITNSGSKMKVMAVVDGYVMFRYSGCIPLTKYLSEFKRQHEIASIIDKRLKKTW